MVFIHAFLPSVFLAVIRNIRIFVQMKKIFFFVVKNFPQQIENTREIIENMSEIIQNISDIFFAIYTPADFQVLGS